MKVYFVSEFGDISIEQDEKNEKNIILKTTDLTPTEEKVIREILNKYRIDKIRCIENEKEIKIDEKGIVEPKSLENIIITLENIKIEDIHKFMKKKLKKDKPVLTALKFKNGKIELIEELKSIGTGNNEIDKVVTVEEPRRGCPMPEMLNSEIRASTVLNEFLTERQKLDFEKFRQIVCIGNCSRKPYLITSRWSPEVVKVGQLYDIVDNKVICANCMEIPPSEEILSLKLMIEFKEKEFRAM